MSTELYIKPLRKKEMQMCGIIPCFPSVTYDWKWTLCPLEPQYTCGVGKFKGFPRKVKQHSMSGYLEAVEDLRSDPQGPKVQRLYYAQCQVQNKKYRE